jgi:hypothetical protein
LRPESPDQVAALLVSIEDRSGDVVGGQIVGGAGWNGPLGHPKLQEAALGDAGRHAGQQQQGGRPREDSRQWEAEGKISGNQHRREKTDQGNVAEGRQGGRCKRDEQDPVREPHSFPGQHQHQRRGV